jgi:selenocysteine-specific elongation factor
VGGIDLVLLVIAADESIKPQTREHFDILQLIGVKRGITVLTKSDTVDAETLAVVRLEVEDFLRGTFLEPPKSPIVAVSALTGAGLEDLKRVIVAAAAEVEPRDSQALARLPIDRVFTMKGFGTVVTGTLISGTIRKDEELEAFPSGRKVRVRSVQVHGQTTDRATAGQRTALNLSGASTEELARGMTLSPPEILVATRRADVRLSLLVSAPRPLKLRTRVHFHSHTMETTAGINLYGKTQIMPGETLFARVALPAPALLLPGDRFIIRQFSPVVTIGGGVVLDVAPMKRAGGLPRFLRHLAEDDAEKALRARISRQRVSGITITALVAETGKTQEAIEEILRVALQRRKILRVGDRLVLGVFLEALKLGLIFRVEQFQGENPLAPGISREHLREQRKVPTEILTAALDSLVHNKKLEIFGELVRLPGRGIVMKDEEAESKKKIEDAFASAELKVPALHEVIASLPLDRDRAQKIVTLLLRERLLVRVSPELVFHRTALEELRRRIMAEKSKSAKIDVARFKELTGVSRKYAIPLLEYLDRERVTKRVGDTREIL